MSADRIHLTADQLAELQQKADAREDAIIQGVLQVPEYPPLAPCPACGENPEKIDSMVENPKFGVHETAVLVNFKPCGHRFRSVVDPGDSA